MIFIRHLVRTVLSAVAYGASTRKISLVILILIGLVLVGLTLATQVVAPVVVYPFA